MKGRSPPFSFQKAQTGKRLQEFSKGFYDRQLRHHSRNTILLTHSPRSKVFQQHKCTGYEKEGILVQIPSMVMSEGRKATPALVYWKRNQRVFWPCMHLPSNQISGT